MNVLIIRKDWDKISVSDLDRKIIMKSDLVVVAPPGKLGANIIKNRTGETGIFDGVKAKEMPEFQ